MVDSSRHDETRTDATGTQDIARDLATLRKLATRLHALASTADNGVLRAILGKREALLESISARLAAMPPPQREGATPPIGEQERRLIAQALVEVTAMDRESESALRKRADEVAAEVRKLRAGRKWRESSQKWT